MKILEKYLPVPYLDEGRTMKGLDCWGLVLALRDELDFPRLPDIGSVTRHTVQEMQHQFKAVSYTLERVERPSVGSIAAVFRASVFIHVGLVVEIDGRLAVIETNEKTGVRWMYLERFLSVYYKVAFYRDRSFS